MFDSYGNLIYFLQMFSFYPLKAPENQELSGVIRVYKMETLTRNEMILQKFWNNAPKLTLDIKLIAY